METIITETFRELCDIDDENIKTLSKALIEKLNPYIKQRPSLRTLASTPLYNKLMELGVILNTMCEDRHAVIKYINYNKEAAGELNGTKYGSDLHYPMYIIANKFGDNFLLLYLIEAPIQRAT